MSLTAVDRRLKDAYIRQSAVILGVVETVADDELVRDDLTDIIRRQCDLRIAALRLVKKSHDLHALRALVHQISGEITERFPAVDYILDDKYICILKISAVKIEYYIDRAMRLRRVSIA